MIPTSDTEQSNKQPDDNGIRSPEWNVPDADLTEFQSCINILCLEPTKSCRSRAILTSAQSSAS